MKQDENTKGRKKAFCKIHEGLLLGIGGFLPQVLAVLAGAWLGVLWGGKEVSEPIKKEIKEIKEQDLKRDSIYSETKARWDTISYIVNSKNDFDKAKKYELDGFHSLIDKKYGEAIWNFMMSENSANRYHASYDIAEYLRDNENSVSVPDFWGNTYKYVIKNFRGYIPTDVLEEMEEFINPQNSKKLGNISINIEK